MDLPPRAIRYMPRDLRIPRPRLFVAIATESSAAILAIAHWMANRAMIAAVGEITGHLMRIATDGEVTTG